MGEIRRATAHLEVLQTAWSSEFVVDTNIDDLGVDAVMARQNVDRGAAVKKVISHLSRDLFWVRADAFLRDTVVGRKDKQKFSPKPRRDFSLDDGDAARQLFQFTKASVRLGQGIEPLLRFSFDGTIQRTDFFDRVV
jgi:hypothetical protein